MKKGPGKPMDVYTVKDGGKVQTFRKDGPDWVASIVCCDCGLAHDIRVGMHKGSLAFRAWRNGKLTRQVRDAHEWR